jgi:hypothetical protein
MTTQGMWTALEMPAERTAVEYEDRQEETLVHSPAIAEAVSAFLLTEPGGRADRRRRRRVGRALGRIYRGRPASGSRGV